ncbi:MAG: UDP-N-acetylglucosamine--N-acetylmuramyl-(pentapeptide) pyrophosphoryl-undecaprenol N-acetylglucosamine transferase [Patescibacteria group bacterium]|nr:UDP-N-acetylglucosamine--N-acetylmuramyl-(pentapeptide) pyrophosphoryl-undecaprenol N-acetylglucosamine transferase [Patescibacteria group bacterium]MDE2015715.1 UDP-N-acetylglucosamine--N-acetylmuramyl-(pentapeptide) pyrophosphoryl-undecaprenol N-acetylglucosamine transferase [Patescibacteria group bacterium]MDE2226773.1 UDP-N-acetylglucosamine--N-acetylmuramyl-(pentapeptide) pyrophosphoryl-undecaprenol N-acetylglucosamine transferase [Patescibacteria group bacterium]
MEYTRKILFTGGGSGGHVYPLLAVSQKLKVLIENEHRSAEFFYMGPKDEYAEILRTADFKITPIFSGKLRRYSSLDNITDIPKFGIGLIQSFVKIFSIMPDVVFSKGGTGALPVVIAAWFYGIPVIIHESDAAPGLTNLLSAPFAVRIAVSFQCVMPYFNRRKVAWIGTPIREELLSENPSASFAKKDLGFDMQEPLTLIIGGSQGSARINEFIVENLAGLLAETQILHQTGQANYADVANLSRAVLTEVAKTAGGKERYRAIPYLDVTTERSAFSAADLVVARAGSGTIADISAFSKPSILIPLRESANDHQRINAYEFAKTGAAIVIEESNLLPGIFLNQLKSLIHKQDTLVKMATASGAMFKKDAAETIAQEILKLSA